MSVIQYLENGRTGKQSLAASLYAELQEDILAGRLKSGVKLTEKKICEDHNVSRTPVREALRQLQAVGLIKNIPNRGAFVLGFSEQDIKDMFQLQALYEVQCVRYGIPRITGEELGELTETFEFMEFYTIKNDIPKMMNINAAFHQIIYNSTHNRILVQIMSGFQTYLRHCVPSNYYAPGYLSQVLEEHRAIYNAFQTADTDAGILAMKDHMEKSEKRMLK